MVTTSSPGTQVFINGSLSVFDKLANGLKVTVWGLFNSASNTIAATIIRAPATKKDQDNDEDNKGILNALLHIKGHAWGLFKNH